MSFSIFRTTFFQMQESLLRATTPAPSRPGHQGTLLQIVMFFFDETGCAPGGEQIDNLQSKLTRPMHLGVCISTILSSLDQWALQIATPNCHLRKSQMRSDHPPPLVFPRRAASQPRNPPTHSLYTVFHTTCTIAMSVINFR